jgi:hypothetical protein
LAFAADYDKKDSLIFAQPVGGATDEKDSQEATQRR